MFGMGAGEMALIGIVAMFFLGPKKIPELAKGMGEGIGLFKKALKSEE
jgi:sec-independent protein translocase protein TatA